MNKELIEKINSLAKKQREVGLSEEEKEEQQRLRQEYLRLFRMEFKKILDSIETVDWLKARQNTAYANKIPKKPNPKVSLEIF